MKTFLERYSTRNISYGKTQFAIQKEDAVKKPRIIIVPCLHSLCSPQKPCEVVSL